MVGKVVHESKVEAREHPWGGMIKDLIKEKHLHLLIGYYDPGEGLKPHTHAISEEIYYVLKGRGAMTLGDSEVDIEAGMAIHIPPNVVHGPTNTGDEPLVIAFILSPVE
ncbi:MAG: cupin domain-containing protein [Nitrososphaeria archaeon]|nr:cupin domain-containing protein [Nitrososphaeria archaeon]NIQ34112.1 cupin domain-containing protein [Nitrososphaeria archaeon]